MAIGMSLQLSLRMSCVMMWIMRHVQLWKCKQTKPNTHEAHICRSVLAIEAHAWRLVAGHEVDRADANPRVVYSLKVVTSIEY